MILLFYAVVNIIGVVIFFKKKKKHLHILEVIIHWIFASYLFQNFSALNYMNFKTIDIPENLSYEFTHVINRLVLFPMLMVTFLNIFQAFHTRLKKLGVILCFMLLFVGLEWIADWLGILVHVDWQLWWSFAFWFGGLLVLIGFMKFYRKILFKGRWDR